MKTLTATEIISIWEHAASLPPAQWALELLAFVLPEATREKLAGLSVGQRDLYLLGLHERCFGSQLTSLTRCPGCGERIELDLTTADVLGLYSDVVEAALTLQLDKYAVQFRVPNSLDMIVTSRYSAEAARDLLLERCVLTATRDGESCTVSTLPPALIAAMTELMDGADPFALIQYRLICPCCQHEWDAIFDIIPFLRAEIDAAARRLLQDVHTMARAYGWSESDILAMSSPRRALYLEMIEQ